MTAKNRPNRVFVRSTANAQNVVFPSVRGDREEVRVKFLDFSMPNLMYNVDARCCTIDLVENGAYRQLLIPHGYYNDGYTLQPPHSLWLVLNGLFGVNWTVVDDPVRARWSFRWNGAGVATIATTAYTILGLVKDAILRCPTGVAVDTPNAYNFAATNTIQIHTTLSTSNSLTDGMLNVSGPSDCFAVVPVTVSFGEMIHWTDEFDWGDALLPASELEGFGVRITDDGGQPLLTNGAEWCATFSIEHMP
jgi:hypothetical protein